MNRNLERMVLIASGLPMIPMVATRVMAERSIPGAGIVLSYIQPRLKDYLQRLRIVPNGIWLPKIYRSLPSHQNGSLSGDSTVTANQESAPVIRLI